MHIRRAQINWLRNRKIPKKQPNPNHLQLYYFTSKVQINLQKFIEILKNESYFNTVPYRYNNQTESYSLLSTIDFKILCSFTQGSARDAQSRRPICVGFTLTTIVSWFVIPDYPGTIAGLGRLAANKWTRCNEWTSARRTVPRH